MDSVRDEPSKEGAGHSKDDKGFDEILHERQLLLDHQRKHTRSCLYPWANRISVRKSIKDTFDKAYLGIRIRKRPIGIRDFSKMNFALIKNRFQNTSFV